MADIILKGCTPEPLMNYLKALGVLRLVAEDPEHGDPNARGRWQNDVFVLSSRLDEKGLEAFFLEHYRPTPLVAPWGARSGFFDGSPEKAAREALSAIEKSDTERLAGYRSAITSVRNLMTTLGLAEKPEEDAKTEFLRQCRAHFPQVLVAWIDACCVLTGDDKKFPPLLGTGGNEGSGSYVSGFAQQVVQCVIEGKHSDALGNALFARLARVDSDQTPGHFSGRALGGPNATQGFEGAATTNPWDYLLCLEGTCLWASGVVRRLDRSGRGVAAFPFTVTVVGAGSPAMAANDDRKPKESTRPVAELWLPLWSRALSTDELQHLLSEGRASVGTRAAESGTDMARAAATLGVNRGIREFARTSFLMRSGQSFLSVPLGRFQVADDRSDASLLGEIDAWLGRFRSACSGDTVPARFKAALRAIDSAVFDFCSHGGHTHFQSILIALGAAERQLATAERFREEKFLRPLAGLSAAWIDAARAPDNGEFEIALALAGLDDPSHAIGPLRSNLEPVALWRNGDSRIGAKWAEADRAVVWNNADLSADLAAALDRRLMDGGRKGCTDLPLASPSAASPASIAAFLRAELDDRKINDLLWGLMLIDRASARGSALPGGGPAPLPPLYTLLKLLFLPRTLLDARATNGTPRWRLASALENGIRIRPEPAILALLRAGRVGEAAAIAMRRLRSSGLSPLPHRRSGGPSRDNDWREVRMSAREGTRLAAALLIPIRAEAVNALVQQATRADTFDEPSPASTSTTE
ncbi:MAG: type I-G CRISPR-associated protein Cas8g1/Csx17 [Phycisphaerales bacterium]